MGFLLIGIAAGIGPFILASAGYRLAGLSFPCLLVLLALFENGPQDTDMPGFGRQLLLLGALTAAMGWVAGAIVHQIRTSASRPKQ